MPFAPDDPIISLTNPRVKRVVRWFKPRERRGDGVLIAEGRREVQRAVAAGLTLVEGFVCPELFKDDAVKLFHSRDATRPRPPGNPASPPTVVTAEVFGKMAYHRKPEGVLAVFEAPRNTLDDLPVRDDALYLVAIGSEKPGNLGAMVRSAAAAGCDAVLAVGPVVDVFNPNAIRNSTGAVFAMPVVTVERDEDAIAWLRRRGVCIAAALVDTTTPHYAADLTGPTALVIGPEHAGLNQAWRDAADLPLTIPMPGLAEAAGYPAIVDSLNASTAAAVLLFEAVRQRSA